MPAALFRDRRLWIMCAYGAACGLPLPLSGFTLRQWLTEYGISLTAIGLTTSIGLAYALKFLWSPLLDQIQPPFGLTRFGRRRGWLLVIQPSLALSCALLAASNPAARPGLLVAAAMLVAFLSASQDIVVDAWRVETFTEQQQGLALPAYVWGYRLALLASTTGAISLASVLGWQGSLSVMAGLAGCGALVTLAAAEPGRAQELAPLRSLPDRLRAGVIEPFRDFLQRPSAGRILAFVMLFKLGEAMAHTLAPPFYQAMGFDRNQVAYAIGVPGLAATLLGAATGGWLVLRIGTGRALVLTGFVQMTSMGLYFALAVSGGDVRILLAKVLLENVAEAMADAAFLTYLSALCTTRFTATQYALLSSLAAVGVRTMGGPAGALATALGWTWFYAMTILAALPAMLVMVSLLRRPPELALTRPAAIP